MLLDKVRLDNSPRMWHTETKLFGKIIIREVHMRVLFIGETGTISMAIARLLVERGDELYLLNRGNRNDSLPAGVI